MFHFVTRVLIVLLRRIGVPDWVLADLRHYLYLSVLNLKNRHIQGALRRHMQLRSTGNSLRLHLGCGGFYMQGWLNLDAYERASRGHRIDCLMDCRSLSIFSDDSCDFIYSHHFFEHLDRETELIPLLHDIYRILKPKGTLRIGVPDLEIYIRHYLEHEESGIQAGREINSIFYDHSHRYMYDYNLIEELLQQVGFSKVVKSAFNSSDIPCFRLEEKDSGDITTLYVEAQK